MQSALEELGQKINVMHSPSQISQEKLTEFAQNCVVALMAGGESSRFRSVPGSDSRNKNAYELPNGDTMIEMTLRHYIEAGFKDFVCLVYHKADTVEKVLGDGSKYDVNIKYCYDPEKPVGKGGAVRNALDKGFIDKDKYLIVHNPDDLIINFDGSFPRHIVSGHLEREEEKLATVVVVKKVQHEYTGMEIVNNKVVEIENYPMLPIPTHVGVTIFSPSCYDFFRELFDLSERVDFEKMLFPVLSKEDKLWAVDIPNECWLPVNNFKAYKKLLKYLE
ncbi:NDP-sugar synthase [Patescibacteria group bacterium]